MQRSPSLSTTSAAACRDCFFVIIFIFTPKSIGAFVELDADAIACLANGFVLVLDELDAEFDEDEMVPVLPAGQNQVRSRSRSSGWAFHLNVKGRGRGGLQSSSFCCYRSLSVSAEGAGPGPLGARDLF